MADATECFTCGGELGDKPRCGNCHKNACDAAYDEGEVDAAKSALEEALSNIRQGEVIGLAKAIQSGDKDAANASLDIIAAELGWSETVAKGRYSR